MFILQSRLVEDFQELRKTLESMNLFNANLGFFFLHFTQILILEVLAWVIVWHFGSGWLVTIFISCLLTVAQVSRCPKPRQQLYGKPQNFFFPLYTGVSCCPALPVMLLISVWHQQVIKTHWAPVLSSVTQGNDFFMKIFWGELNKLLCRVPSTETGMW